MSIGDFLNEETIQERLNKDIRYIKKDLITQIKEGKDEYCKFSKPLNAICILSFTKNSYIKYWTQLYLHYPKEQETITEVCNEKFENGLTPKETMIKLVENSNDNTQDKTDILCALKGLPKPKKLSQVEIRRQMQLQNLINEMKQINDPENDRHYVIKEAIKNDNTKNKGIKI